MQHPKHHPGVQLDSKFALTVDEFAALSGLGRSKLYVAMRDGLLQARKFGRRTVILREEGQRFLNALPKAA
jgi:excisionase family DNA binding protein